MGTLLPLNGMDDDDRYVRPHNTQTEMYDWRRRVLSPGESSWVCTVSSVNVSKKRWDGRTDARPLHYAYR